MNYIKNINAALCLQICIILCMAQGMQFFYHELPCPLCLIQRVGYIGMAFGYILNAYDRPRPIHYAISLISAMFTASVAIRQILLHIVPNTGVYGASFFGFHLYVWSFLISSFNILLISILFINMQQFNVSAKVKSSYHFAYKIIFIGIIILALVNSVTTFHLCGLNSCPENPIRYLW